MSDSIALPSDAMLRARVRAAAREARNADQNPRGPRIFKRGVITIVSLGLLFVASVAAINLYMTLRVQGEITSAADAPHAQAAIILGALVMDDGSMSLMLADRVQRGAELYRAGKVDRVIVSGDHHTWAYDEPTTMRKALERQGVPANKIFTDHAGFSTWATMVRARKVFNVESALVVTQGFHMSRALYLANSAGLTASGVTSDLQPYGRQQTVSEVREVPARVKAFGSALFNSKVLLGPKIPIESASARTSWGPSHPPK